MLPTPDTSHVPYSRVYEPAEDSFLMIDTLALPAETAFLQKRFGTSSVSNAAEAPSPSSPSSPPLPPPPPPPLVVEIGSGSGVVLGFVVAQSAHLFGAGSSVLAMAVDVNTFACQATSETIRRAQTEEAQAQSRPDDGAAASSQSHYLGAARADLASALRPGQVDVLLFNPPYVPTPDLPVLPSGDGQTDGPTGLTTTTPKPSLDTFARDSHLLELAYAGGRDGMETTDRLLDALPTVLAPRGCAYVLLCAQNRPDTVKERIRAWPPSADAETGRERRWQAETVGSSGKQAGWEKLQIVRIWQE